MRRKLRKSYLQEPNKVPNTPCWWRGTAPFCEGECDGGEVVYQKAPDKSVISNIFEFRKWRETRELKVRLHALAGAVREGVLGRGEGFLVFAVCLFLG